MPQFSIAAELVSCAIAFEERSKVLKEVIEFGYSQATSLTVMTTAQKRAAKAAATKAAETTWGTLTNNDRALTCRDPALIKFIQTAAAYAALEVAIKHGERRTNANKPPKTAGEIKAVQVITKGMKEMTIPNHDDQMEE